MFATWSTLGADVAHPGDAFRGVLLVVLLGAVLLIVLHGVLSLFGRREGVAKSRWNVWEKLVYLATILSVAVLGVTAFFGVLCFGVLDGWLLFAHLFGAGAFVFVLPVLAITWCGANRFGRRLPASGSEDAAPRLFWCPKVMFWIILASGLAVSVTMLLSMLPLFGTEGLTRLLDIHRYSGLVAVVATILHLYGVCLERVGLR